MILLDENIPRGHLQVLSEHRVHARQIAYEIGYEGIKDEQVIPMLHRLRRPTLFTLDLRLYRRQLRHEGYCIVTMDVKAAEAADFVRRLLRHEAFNTQAKRMGTIVRLTDTGIRCWRLHEHHEREFHWPD